MQLCRQVAVLVVEDHDIMRFGLRSMLRSLDGATVVGETDNSAEAILLAERLKPDLVLMDLKLNASNGTTTTRRIKQMAPNTVVLALTSLDIRENLIENMAAGADGYCLKTSTSNDLIKAILTVLRGESWIDPLLAGELLRRKSRTSLRRRRAIHYLHPALTPRELEILKLIVDGFTNPRIAKQLFLSIDTVKTHIKHILDKLSAVDRTQAAVEAMKRGLI